MLTFEQLKEYFPAEILRINPKGALVEYLQYEFLDSLFKQPGSEKLAFIGGTAIRIIYNSQRFSEDLDFDNFGLDYGAFRRLIGKVCREMEVKGFAAEWRFLKKGAVFHAYVKFPSVLKQYGLAGHHLEKIFVAIDAERKKKLALPVIKPINKFGVFRSVLAGSAAVILAQKLIAILRRRRERGRDFYDVSYLLGLTGPDFAYIEAATGLKRDEFLRRFRERCAAFNYKLLAREVAPFLFDETQKERVENFPRNVLELLGIGAPETM